MVNLDMNYVADLIVQAQDGDSNAFAEFYAATYEKQYLFAQRFLQDSFAAQEALVKTYTNALKNLHKLLDPQLSVAWLTQLNLRACCEIRLIEHREEPLESRTVQIGDTDYTVRRIITLPFTESQVLLLRHVCGMRDKEIASLLEITRQEVRRYGKTAVRRLEIPGQSGNGKDREHGTVS